MGLFCGTSDSRQLQVFVVPVSARAHGGGDAAALHAAQHCARKREPRQGAQGFRGLFCVLLGLFCALVGLFVGPLAPLGTSDSLLRRCPGLGPG